MLFIEYILTFHKRDYSQIGRYDEKDLPSTPHRPQCGQPALYNKAHEVENAVMCMGIESCRFASVFQRICLSFNAPNEVLTL